MAGVEAIIGGAFVSAIIKVAKVGRSYCAGKYKEHKDTQEILDNLEASLPLILGAIEFAEQETTALGANLREWLRQLKDVTHEAEDVMDDFEAKRISFKNKGKVSEIATSSAKAVKSLILSDQDEKNLKNLIRKINILCKGIGDFTKVIESRNKEPTDKLNSSSTRETTSKSKIKKIFGREVEIKLILDMIIDHPKSPFYNSYFGYGLRQDPSHVNEETTSPHNTPSILEKKALEIKHSTSTSRSSYANTSIFVGKRRLSILPIVGIGGVGKTTIARVIYNHHTVHNQFDLQGWVYVVDNIDHKKLIEEILRSFDVNTPTITTLEIGYRMLKSAIREKKVFNYF